MNPTYTVEALSKGGRTGTVQSPDRALDLTLSAPAPAASASKYYSSLTPEHLFAGAYSACFHGALVHAAQAQGCETEGSSVRARVSVVEDSPGASHLAVELRAHLPGVEPTQTRRIMDEAHLRCLYSKALRGEVAVELFAD